MSHFEVKGRTFKPIRCTTERWIDFALQDDLCAARAKTDALPINSDIAVHYGLNGVPNQIALDGNS